MMARGTAAASDSASLPIANVLSCTSVTVPICLLNSAMHFRPQSQSSIADQDLARRPVIRASARRCRRKEFMNVPVHQLAGPMLSLNIPRNQSRCNRAPALAAAVTDAWPPPMQLAAQTSAIWSLLTKLRHLSLPV